MLRGEMMAYGPSLARKPQMVVINKMDLYGPEHRDLRKLGEALKGLGLDYLPISALTGEGIEELRGMILEKCKQDKGIGSRV